MSQVPTTNINALYNNTTAGTVASPTNMDAAVQDIVATINGIDTALSNYQAGTRYNVDGGAFSDTEFVNTIDGGTF